MQICKSVLALALLAACSSAFAGNSGTLTRKGGKPAPVTAIYVQPDHVAAYIVFSDNEKATKVVEHLANTSYGSIDGILSAEHIFRDLAANGAHPLLLNIGGWISDNEPIFDLQMSDGGRIKNLQHDKAKVRIDHDDEKRIEGRLSYADNELELDLPFALDKGPGTFAGAGLPNTPPPPPPPPAPKSPRG